MIDICKLQKTISLILASSSEKYWKYIICFIIAVIFLYAAFDIGVHHERLNTSKQYLDQLEL
jgi:hypothetical protein